MRWNGTGEINSSVKRKYSKRLKSRKPETLECEGPQRFWLYDDIKNYGKILAHGGLRMP